jgi:hypothetical protein
MSGLGQVVVSGGSGVGVGNSDASVADNPAHPLRFYALARFWRL